MPQRSRAVKTARDSSRAAWLFPGRGYRCSRKNATASPATWACTASRPRLPGSQHSPGTAGLPQAWQRARKLQCPASSSSCTQACGRAARLAASVWRAGGCPAATACPRHRNAVMVDPAGMKPACTRGSASQDSCAALPPLPWESATNGPWHPQPAARPGHGCRTGPSPPSTGRATLRLPIPHRHRQRARRGSGPVGPVFIDILTVQAANRRPRPPPAMAGPTGTAPSTRHNVPMRQLRMFRLPAGLFPTPPFCRQRRNNFRCRGYVALQQSMTGPGTAAFAPSARSSCAPRPVSGFDFHDQIATTAAEAIFLG